jgi:hypothetical protein
LSVISTFVLILLVYLHLFHHFSPFFVEEVAKCPGCSLNIGGRDHNQTEHTFQDDESAAWGDG